jgi:hypothetical protein
MGQPCLSHHCARGARRRVIRVEPLGRLPLRLPSRFECELGKVIGERLAVKVGPMAFAPLGEGSGQFVVGRHDRYSVAGPPGTVTARRYSSLEGRSYYYLFRLLP